MKSPMITDASYISAAGKRRYSDLQVLQSNAGYYIGTTYNDPEIGIVPGSRDSEYFPTEREAQLELESIEKTNDTSSLRVNP